MGGTGCRPSERGSGTIAAAALAAAKGAQIHRLHDLEALDAVARSPTDARIAAAGRRPMIAVRRR